MRRLMGVSVLVIENTGENAEGEATTRTTEHAASFAEVTEAERRSASGPLPANAVNVVMLPWGYGVTWSIKTGDTIRYDGTSYSVLSCSAVRNPRTLQLSHIEATCG